MRPTRYLIPLAVHGVKMWLAFFGRRVVHRRPVPLIASGILHTLSSRVLYPVYFRLATGFHPASRRRPTVTIREPCLPFGLQ